MTAKHSPPLWLFPIQFSNASLFKGVGFAAVLESNETNKNLNDSVSLEAKMRSTCMDEQIVILSSASTID